MVLVTTPPTPQHEPQDSIGAVLRAARAARGVSLAEMRARTKIDGRFLAAFESDRLSDLPPLPFARGFLRTYAIELGLDSEPLVRRLVALLAVDEPPATEELRHLDNAITPGRPISKLRQTATNAATIAAVAGVILAIFFFQQVREFNRQAVPPATTDDTQTPTDVPPSAAVAPPAPGAPPLPQISPAGEAPPGASEAIGIIVDVQAVGRSWIRVLGEEGEIFEGILSPGQSRRWQSEGPLTIRVGNAAAVVLTVNGRTVGTLGRRGQVVSRTFSKAAQP